MPDIKLTEQGWGRLLASAEFAKAERMVSFLQFLAARKPGERVKETEIGTAVFGRPVGYDPKSDSIVRVEATRLRKKLARYYETEGAAEAVRVSMPPGKYELEYTLPARPAEEPVVPPPAGFRFRPAWVPAGLLLVAVGVGIGLLQSRATRPMALEIRQLTSLAGYEDHAAISPDGTKVVFTWDGGPGPMALYEQSLGSSEKRRVTSAGAVENWPAWSADGKLLAYISWTGPKQAALQIRELASGRTDTLAGLTLGPEKQAGVTWSPDGRWLVTAEESPTDGTMQLVLVDRASKTKQPYRPKAGVSRQGAVISRDGSRVAFVEMQDVAAGDVWVADFPNGAERRVTEDRTIIQGLAWMDGREELLLAAYRKQGRSSLWRLRIGSGRMDRLTDGSSDMRYPAWAAGNVVSSRHVGNVEVWRRTGDFRGRGEAWIRSSGLNSGARFSPDGKRVALRSNRTGRSEIWVMDVDTGETRQLTHFDGPVTGSPSWSPDGRRIAFDSRKFGQADIFAVAAEGGEVERLTDGAANEVVPSWTRDGKAVLYASDGDGAWALWKKDLVTGRAEKVRDRAFAGVEDARGEYLYYARGTQAPGLFRAPVAGGAEEPVAASLPTSMSRNWALGAGGVWWVDEAVDGGMRLWFWHDGRKEDRGPVGNLVRWDAGLALAPDGKTLLLAQARNGDSDLYWLNGVR